MHHSLDPSIIKPRITPCSIENNVINAEKCALLAPPGIRVALEKVRYKDWENRYTRDTAMYYVNDKVCVANIYKIPGGGVGRDEFDRPYSRLSKDIIDVFNQD